MRIDRSTHMGHGAQCVAGASLLARSLIFRSKKNLHFRHAIYSALSTLKWRYYVVGVVETRKFIDALSNWIWIFPKLAPHWHRLTLHNFFPRKFIWILSIEWKPNDPAHWRAASGGRIREKQWSDVIKVFCSMPRESKKERHLRTAGPLGGRLNNGHTKK